jgi:hypothetical protein
MTSQSEQLEQEADQTRAELSATLEELRARITPGQIIDRAVAYASEGPAAEFLSNIGREIRENPLPLVLIGIGITWLMVASRRSSRAVIASTADSAMQKAAETGTTTSAAVSRTSGWGQHAASRSADRVSDLTSRGTHGIPGAVVEQVRVARVASSSSADASDARSAEQPEGVSACAEAEDEAGRPRLTPAIIALGDAEVQPERGWEHAGAVGPAHERR